MKKHEKLVNRIRNNAPQIALAAGVGIGIWATLAYASLRDAGKLTFEADATDLSKVADGLGHLRFVGEDFDFTLMNTPE